MPLTYRRAALDLTCCVCVFQAQLARHPPVVQYSEGQNYNIINNVVTNEERLRKGARLQVPSTK